MKPSAPSHGPDPFFAATAQAREAINAARDTQESVRATRLRVRLQGLIMSWRGRRTLETSVQSERLALILDAVRDEACAPMGNIQVFQDGALRIRSSSGLDDGFLSHFAAVTDGDCCCGAAYRAAAAVVVEDVQRSPLFAPADRDRLLASGIHACQSLALSHGTRRLGVISLHYREPAIPARRRTALNDLTADISEAVALALAA